MLKRTNLNGATYSVGCLIFINLCSSVERLVYNSFFYHKENRAYPTVSSTDEFLVIA